MRIAIDVRNLQEKHLSGVGWYTTHLLDALFALRTPHTYTLCHSSWKKPPEHLFRWKDAPHVRYHERRLPSKLLTVCYILAHAPDFRTLYGAHDAVLMPNHLFWAFDPTEKVALVLHDFSFELYPEFFTRKMRLWHRAIRPYALMRRANALVAVSEHTKNDAIRLGANEEKLTVVHEGASHVPQAQSSSSDYRSGAILSLGNLEPRKNIFLLLEAYRILRTLHEEIRNPLLIVGSTQWWNDAKLRRAISRNPFHKDITVTGYVSERKKSTLFASAAAFAYPSRYEGFGLPPLEAMRMGVPVVASHAPALPEILGDAAVLIDPYKPEELAEALWQTLTDEQLRSDLIAQGFARAKKYDWRKTAQGILEVLEKLAS